MKKIILIVMLIALHFSWCLYASEINDDSHSVYTAPTPTIKVLEKLSKVNQVPFFYSAISLKDIELDDKNIDYNSLHQTLDYPQTNYSIKFVMQNNRASTRKILRKTEQDRNIVANSNSKKDTIIDDKEKKIDEIVLIGYGK